MWRYGSRFYQLGIMLISAAIASGCGTTISGEAVLARGPSSPNTSIASSPKNPDRTPSTNTNGSVPILPSFAPPPELPRFAPAAPRAALSCPAEATVFQDRHICFQPPTGFTSTNEAQSYYKDLAGGGGFWGKG